MPNATAEDMIAMFTRHQRRKLAAILRKQPHLSPKAQVAAVMG